MVWMIELDKKAVKQLDKLGKPAQKQIRDFLANKIRRLSNPRRLGKPLSGTHKGLWSYRTGVYRVVCEIKDSTLVVIVVNVGHRKSVYS